MVSKYFLVLLILLFSQGSRRVESLSISNETLAKLRSISHWLDSMTDASIYDYIYRINRGVGLNLFEGDIKGYNPRKALLRTAITNHQQLWNTRVVPYIIDSSFDSASQKDIFAAIAEYHEKTCIRWVPRTTENDYVHFKQISGCFSNIGRTGGGQDISLMGACLKKGTAVHEMMHALGFWHEQSRPDRDSWVHVITSNIQDGKGYNFDKLDANKVDTLGVQYDYGSVMHYSKYAFTKNGNPTIMPTRPTGAAIGQRNGLSNHDVERITKLYGCNYVVPTLPDPEKPATTTKVPETKPPQTKPPVTQLPQTQPPVTQPPQTQLPVTQPPQTQPPVTQPPQTQPPVTQPPQTQPPVTQPPQTQSPVTQPPQTQQPVTNPPTTKRPKTTPKPATNPPTTQPITQPSTKQPPTTLKHTAQPMTNALVTHPQPTHLHETQPSHTDAKTVASTSNHFTKVVPMVATRRPVLVYQPGWTLWSEWSPCDLQCKHSRYRFCLNYDSNYCIGENSEVGDCQLPCKSASTFGCWKQDDKQLTVPSVEGHYPSLTHSYRDRTEAIRKCGNYASVMGFTVFALFDGGQCLTGPDAPAQFSKLGASSKCDFRGVGAADAMNVYTFNPDIDGQWSVWTNWGHCTRTCGLGRQYRYRRCDNPPPIGNGAPCSGTDRDIAVCNHGTCVAPMKCGTRYHAGGPGSSGLIWLRGYENFMECEYEIATGDPFSSISLYIHQIDIEYSKGCIYDTLMLHDGYNARAPLVGSFCGSSAPGTFESSSNNVYLKFTSDETNTGRGFTVFYSINSQSRKACPKPPPSAHASISMEGNMVGNRAWYSCHPGYKIVGYSPITCVDQPGFALWDDKFPRCVNARKRSVKASFGTKCSFKDSLCGYRNELDNDFDWSVTRSSGDARNKDLHGNVLHAESNRLHQSGALGRIRTSTFRNIAPSNCLTFVYKIDGGDVATFNVYTVDTHTAMTTTANVTVDTHTAMTTTANVTVDTHTAMTTTANVTDDSFGGVLKSTLIMEETGHDENKWLMASLNIYAEYDFQVIFEAVLGDEIGSSVALDDISLTHDHCQASYKRQVA